MSLRRKLESQDGYEISYLTQGEGPTLVLLAPMLHSSVWWDETGYIGRLAERHAVIAVDMLGHGDSDKPIDPAAYNEEAVVGHVLEVLEAENVGDAVVWGLGNGAETAGVVGRRRTDVVKAVVCGGMYLGDVLAGLRARGIDGAEIAESAAQAVERGDWDMYFRLMPVDVPPDLGAIHRAGTDPRAVAAMTRANLARHRSFLKPPSPTLVYWAAGDNFALDNARIAEQMPIETWVVPGGRADSFLQVDLVCERVERFLDEHVTR